jgi:hypothetical protein
MNYPRPIATKSPALKTAIWIVALTIFVFSTLHARTKVVDKWENEEAKIEKPEKIAVIAVLPDALMREAFEIDVAKKLSKKNRIVIAGSKIPGMSGGIRGKINTNAAKESLSAAAVDGVIVMFYQGGGVSGTYERADYWAKYEGTAVGYGGYGWGQPYFVNVYSVQKGEGWADFARSALVESSYYDLKTSQPIWRIVTETTDIEHTDAALRIAKKISSQMRASKL